jgi:hypothetical protein
MPLPRGRKSRPTMFSRTDDFPEDCDPTTTWNRGISTSQRVRGVPAYNLRKVQTIIADGIEDKILQLVDYP